MSQEQQDIQRLIARARRAGPNDEALARVWQRLQAPPPVGPDGGGIEAPDPAALADATRAIAGKAALAGGLKAIAAAAAVGAALVGGRWWTREEPAPPRPAVTTAVHAPASGAEGPAVEAIVEATGEPVEATAVEAPRVRPSGRRKASEDREVAGDELDAGAERELVEAAQAALQRGATAAALASLDEHARRFARGLLADEREVLRVLVLCAERREAEAERAAQALLRASAAGLFLPRLRGSCVGERLVPVQRPKGRGGD